MLAPQYKGLRPASTKASAAARGASRKADTKPEVILRRALWHNGLRYRKNVRSMLGKPDILFPGPRVVVFCDGDFWHGNHWLERKARLSGGTNSAYWIAKIERNIERDREVNQALGALGWVVLRFWESDIKQNTNLVAHIIRGVVKGERKNQPEYVLRCTPNDTGGRMMVDTKI